MKKLFSAILITGFVFLMVGCRTTPIVDIDNSQYLERSQKMTKVESAITKGAATKGWRVKKLKNGLLEASITIRNKFLVVVDIPYTSKGYKINYKKSTNLKYDPQTKTIHKNYNGWIKNLVNNIDYELSNIGDVSSVSSSSVVAPVTIAKAVKPKTYSKGKKLSLEGKTIYIKPMLSYAPNSKVAANIKSECTIPKQIVDFIVKFSNEQGINVVVKNNISSKDIELKVQIDDAVSSGGAMRGHHKFVTISGKLVKGKTEYESFQAGRVSGGGFWGAYKSSCSVLGRTTNTLGKDVAGWLASPYDDIILGDQYLIR